MEQAKECIYCGRRLRSYKVWRDWKSRPSHYSCYIRNGQEWSFREMMKTFMEEEEKKKARLSVSELVEEE